LAIRFELTGEKVVLFGFFKSDSDGFLEWGVGGEYKTGMRGESGGD
jgi:hypothetical protein